MTRKGRKWTIEQRKVQSDCKKKYWIDHPEQKVLPCVHRAPKENKDEYRLLLIC